MPYGNILVQLVSSNTYSEAKHVYIKSETLSNKDLNKPWITREIISKIRKTQHYFTLYCQNKIPKDFYTHFLNFVTSKI